MFGNLKVFKMAHGMAVHAGQKQAVTAQNVANSDTPEYKARNVIPFSQTYKNETNDIGWLSQKSTRSTHIHGTTSGELPDPIVDEKSPGAPNGNSVSLESEMLKSLDAKRQHDRAMAIYKSSMNILRSSFKRA